MIQKQQLLDQHKDLFINNLYLDLYVVLINKNLTTPNISKRTQLHHIIPKCYYKKNNMIINNDRSNLVNLLYVDHIKAHYLLSKCTLGQFAYLNAISVNFLYKRLCIGDIIDTESQLMVQECYERQAEEFYSNNPMSNLDIREKHDKKMRSDEVRQKISISMKKMREDNPFTESHRKNLSLAMVGNHNFGNGDTRSIPCHCIDTCGNIIHFHNYKCGGIWWFNTYKPFGQRYVQVTLQRKIVKSITENHPINGVQWFRDEFDQSVETIERVDDNKSSSN